MKKAVLLSIKPKWCDKILRGEKTIEIRKGRPYLKTPFRCYIYCSKAPKGWVRMDNIQLDGKVIGEFTCEKIQNSFHLGYMGQRDRCYCTADQNHNIDLWQEELLEKSAMNLGELDQYLHGKGFAWYISGLKIYDKPMDITEFTGLKDFHGIMDVNPVEKPPQSWRYVLELKEEKF